MGLEHKQVTGCNQWSSRNLLCHRALDFRQVFMGLWATGLDNNTTRVTLPTDLPPMITTSRASVYPHIFFPLLWSLTTVRVQVAGSLQRERERGAHAERDHESTKAQLKVMTHNMYVTHDIYYLFHIIIPNMSHIPNMPHIIYTTYQACHISFIPHIIIIYATSNTNHVTYHLSHVLFMSHMPSMPHMLHIT